MSHATALLVAFGGAACFGVSATLQRLAARSSDHHDGNPRGVGAALIGQLVHSPLFLAGVLLDLIGMVASLVAVRALPVYVVEVVLAASVAVAAFISSKGLGERVSPMRWAAVAILSVSLVVVATTGKSAGAGRLHGALVLLPLAGPPLLFGAGRVLAASQRRWVGAAFGVLSGVAFGMANLTARLLPPPSWPLEATGVVFVVSVAGWVAAGLVMFGAGVRERDATTVIVGQTVGEAVIPSLIALALGDRWQPGSAWLAGLAFVVAIAAAVMVAVGEPAGSDG
ncbi:MAG: integral rane protein, partial [Acidimicrobiia bacterium]|nr:integral rane protein [Acidimicrobiia bacterium]